MLIGGENEISLQYLFFIVVLCKNVIFSCRKYLIQFVTTLYYLYSIHTQKFDILM